MSSFADFPKMMTQTVCKKMLNFDAQIVKTEHG